MSLSQSGRKSKPSIPWKRFWCFLGAPINCGITGRGFLSDPEDVFWQHTPRSVHRLDEILPQSGPLILCGEPGIGKTTEFENLRVRIHSEFPGQTNLIALNFRQQIADMADFRRLTVETSKWTKWRDGNNHITLMIDGVDEGLLRISNFVAFLTGILKEEPTERLRLILTCRSAEWPQAMGNDLIDLWPRLDSEKKPVYELCPLRRKDAEEAARHEGCDSQDFMKALREMHVEGLANRPVTLFLLLNEFRAHGRFPATHRELYERGTRKLVDEIDPKRLEALTALSKTTLRASLDERLAAAQRIAALLLCCGKSAVCRDEDKSEQQDKYLLYVSRCSGLPASVSNLALREVVESALFTSIGEGRFGFTHQTFAECLAAQQIAKLPLVQVRKLLLQRDDEGEHVVPQLAELTAWTAGYHPGLCAYLLETEPTSLLRSDVALLTDQTKVEIVAAILQGADKGTVLDPYEFYQFFFGLRHPGIEAQVRPYIVERGHHYIARRIAFKLVERCRLSSLSDELLSIVSDAEDNMREEAADALCDVISDARLSELEPLARGEVGGDPKDAIRGAALQRLIPKHWKMRDAFNCFVPWTNERVVGTYHMLLSHDLPQYLEFDDILPGLEWIRHKSGMPDTLSPRKELAVKIITMALENLNDPVICAALMRLWFDLAKECQIHALDQHQEVIKLISEKPEIKRQLTTALLNHVKPNKDKGFDTRRIFGNLISFDEPTDFEWLLDQIAVVPVECRSAWASVIAGLALLKSAVVAPSWDKLLQRIHDLPELAVCFEWLREWDLDAPWVRTIKARWLKQKCAQDKFQRRYGKLAPDPAPIRHAALKRAEDGDPEAWHDLWHSLLQKEGDPNPKYWDPEVVKYPGWELLSEHEKDLACKTARLFLIHHSEAAKEWMPDHYTTHAGIAAVWLLKGRVSDDAWLRDVISNSWVGHCVRMRGFAHDVSEQLFAFVYAINPEAALAALYLDADSESGVRQAASPRKASKCWDQRVSVATGNYLDALTYPKTIRSGIEDWGVFDRPAASEFAIKYLNSCSLTSESCSIGLRDALAACLLVNFGQTFDIAAKIMSEDPHLARSVWCEVLYRRYSQTDKLWELISERQMSELYIQLHSLFPREEYPEERDVGFVSTTQAALEARARLPGMLASRGTDEACTQLRRMMNEIPSEASGLQWSYQQALLNRS